MNICNMNNEVKYIKGNSEHMNRKRPTDTMRNHPPMSIKRNSKRRASDSKRKADALHDKYSYSMQRKDERRNNRKAKQRELTR